MTVKQMVNSNGKKTKQKRSRKEKPPKSALRELKKTADVEKKEKRRSK